MADFEIVAVVEAALAGARFTVFPPLPVASDRTEREEIRWEIFHGQLLSAAMTRETKAFRAWNVRGVINGQPNDEPFVSIKHEIGGQQLFVTRGLLCYGHRVVTTGNVIETQEDKLWTRELVGSLDPSQLTATELSRELEHLVFASIVGTSQLPLTSLEAPLPEFSFGQLGYSPNSPGREYTVKRLELLLRAPTPIASVASQYVPDDAIATLRDVFLSVSLSPYTNFVSRSLSLLKELETSGAITAEERIDFLGWVLRLQWRHLNAYDLFLFHNRGANYPDALLVDEVLRELLACAVAQPAAFAGDAARLRRRGLRCGWFLREIYAGHRVPSHPTSPGENNRVLPAPWQRLSEDEINNPYRRSEELFRDSIELPPKTEALLRESIAELTDDRELLEFGTALILDRPLGWSKQVGEPDMTPPLAYIARSRKLALRHVDQLERNKSPFFAAEFAAEIRQRLASLPIDGVSLPHLQRPPRPGVLSLTDAFQSADDFMIDRSTQRSLTHFHTLFDWSAIGERIEDLPNWRLILPRAAHGTEVLEVYNQQLQPWLQLEVDARSGYQRRLGVELPVNGLRAKLLSDGTDHIVRPR